MPGREARTACSSSISAAMSVTADSTRRFCFSQRRPPSRASIGRLFGPADVLLHQADFRGGHVELGLALKFQFQVLLDLPVLFQQLHAAVAGDAVAEVYDEVAFVEIQEAVDRPAQPSAHGQRDAARRHGGRARRC